MHRFYFLETITGDAVEITSTDLIHQIRRVLRLKVGDECVLFNDTTEYTVRIDSISGSAVRCTIVASLECVRDNDCRVVVYQSLLKADKFEWVIQKLTELGVSQIVPVVSEHCVVRDISGKKKERYQKIIREAVEQCGGCALPFLKEVSDFDMAITSLENGDITVICHEKEETQSLLDVIKNKTSHTINIFLGPEGGFSPKEIEAARGKGVAVVHLGKRVLRAETASVTATGLIIALQQ